MPVGIITSHWDENGMEIVAMESLELSEGYSFFRLISMARQFFSSVTTRPTA